MITLQEQAYAKLNLTLDILGKRPDGYHELESVMQQITLCDEVEIELETGEDWKLECDWPEIPTDSENLAWKAVGVFYKTLGKDPGGVTIRISKRTLTIVHQNIVFALGVKFIVLILSALGLGNMWIAVFADVGVSVLAILNAMRALRFRD